MWVDVRVEGARVVAAGDLSRVHHHTNGQHGGLFCKILIYSRRGSFMARPEIWPTTCTENFFVLRVALPERPWRERYAWRLPSTHPPTHSRFPPLCVSAFNPPCVLKSNTPACASFPFPFSPPPPPSRALTPSYREIHEAHPLLYDL